MLKQVRCMFEGLSLCRKKFRNRKDENEVYWHKHNKFNFILSFFKE